MTPLPCLAPLPAPIHTAPASISGPLLSAPMAQFIGSLQGIAANQTDHRAVSYFLSNEDFVTQAYLKENGRLPSETEALSLVTDLNAGRTTQSDLMRTYIDPLKRQHYGGAHRYSFTVLRQPSGQSTSGEMIP